MSGVVFWILCVHAAAQLTVSDLPLSIPGTSIMLLGVEPYSGVFLEDGGCELVENIVAAVFRNDGPCTVSESQITLVQGGQTSMFWITMLPPGQSVLVLDQNRKPYLSDRVDSCTGWEISRRWVECPYVNAMTCEEGIRVHNTGVLATGQVRMRFKTYDRERKLYVGGITYEANIDTLQPGESKTVRPWYYQRETSRILEITIKKQSA